VDRRSTLCGSQSLFSGLSLGGFFSNFFLSYAVDLSLYLYKIDNYRLRSTFAHSIKMTYKMACETRLIECILLKSLAGSGAIEDTRTFMYISIHKYTYYLGTI
jgi:hypothetical protein